jgi:oligopeptide transport system substrate-binding protein
VVITLATPTPYFLSLLGSCTEFSPVRQDKVEEFGVDFAATADKNIYSGPFVLTSSENMELHYAKNPNYWNTDAVNFDEVIQYIVPNADTQLAMYESGDIDLVYVPLDSVPLYDDVDESYQNGNDDFLYINSACETQPLLQDKNFRLALNYAINHAEYITLATNDVYDPATTFVLPLVGGAHATYGEEFGDYLHAFPLEGDEAKAKEYLQLAMDAAGITDPSDITLEFVCTDNETEKRIVETIAYMWDRALGINVEIRQITYAEKYTVIFTNHDYEVGYGGWSPDYSDPYTYLELFKGDNPNNYSAYNNPEYDALMYASITEPDPEARMQMLADAENILLDDGAVVPLQFRTQHYLLAEGFTGIKFSLGAVNLDWPFGDVEQ